MPTPKLEKVRGASGGAGAESGKPVGGKKKTGMTLEGFFAQEMPLLSDIITFCNQLPMSLYADSTVVKSPEVVFRGLALSQNRLVAEEYLLNYRRSEADFGVVIGINNYRRPMVVGALANRGLEESDEELIRLPRYKNVRAPIGSVIKSRRSVRSYSGKAVSMAELSTILYHGNGISGRLQMEHLPETATFGRLEGLDLRTAVSGGALYPVELYVLALNVEQLVTGAYRYLPRFHALKPIGPLGRSFSISGMAQFGEIEVEKASFLLAYVYNVFENARKYGESGLAFALIEAGSIATNVHLICTALGAGSCDVGSFSKHRFERLLDADGISRHMIHLTVIGKGERAR